MSLTGDRIGGDADEMRGIGEARPGRFGTVDFGRRIEGGRWFEEEDEGRGGVGIDDKGGFGMDEVTESKKASNESSCVLLEEGE